MNARISYRTFVLVGLVSLATVSTAFAGGKGPFTYPGKVNGGMRSTIGCYPSGKSGSTELTAALIPLIKLFGSPSVFITIEACGQGLCQNGITISADSSRDPAERRL